MGMHWLEQRDVTCQSLIPPGRMLCSLNVQLQPLSSFWGKMGLVVLLMGSGDKEGLGSSGQ